MDVEVVATDRLAEHAASRVSALLRAAIAERGTATLAVSGGTTPAAMLAALADLPLPWDRLHVFQVDERIAPAGDPARNLAQVQERLAAGLPVPLGGLHAMPVEAALAGDGAASAGDGAAAVAAARYAAQLSAVAGDPPVLDVVHLGLGDDGHTASLVADDPVLAVDDRAVAATGPYRGHRRLTLTYPTLARARRRVWLVAGTGKAEAVARLVAGDPTIPAGRVSPGASLLLLDPPAASRLPRSATTSLSLEGDDVTNRDAPGSGRSSAPPA